MRKPTLCAAAILVASILWPASRSLAITVMFTDPNTTVILGQPYSNLEFNNPLTGSETVNGCSVVEWRDAGFFCPGPVYEDWAVSMPCACPSPTPNTCVDGYANEIWLRNPTDVATTITTVPGTMVSIHLHGDSNDGVCDVMVDGVLRAQLDMYTAGVDNALVIVDNLPSATHTIEVIDVGPGAGGPGTDDIALMGAAVLECFFWKGGSSSPMFDLDQKQGLWGDTCPPGFTFTWCGPVALANSVGWFDANTTPGLVPLSLRDAGGNVDPMLLVEHLAQYAKGGTPGCNGVTGFELMGIAWEFFRLQPTPHEFSFHSVPTRIDTICAELKKSQDVILLLGFYFSDGAVVMRTGGHFVTLAGCGTWQGAPAIAFSDPYFDSNAAGFSPGRHNGPHGDPRAAPSDPVQHNDPANYSHDIFTLTIMPGPQPLDDRIQVEGYDAEYQEPFEGQNPAPETEAPPHPPVLPSGSYTYIDYVFGISPRDTLTVVGIEPDTRRAPHAVLRQNYPNPFHPGTTIEFVLPTSTHVNLSIYDAAGKLVRTLVDGVRSGDRVHVAEWDGRNTAGRSVASGIYFYRLIAGTDVQTRKMVHLR
jgi:hypothetical protein